MFRTMVKQAGVAQEVVRRTPLERLIEAFMAILADALGLVEANRRVRPDGALQRTFGRDDWAEQPVIGKTRNTSTPENVQQMQQAVKAVYQHQNTSYGSALMQSLQLMDIDMTVIDPNNWTPCERSVCFPGGSSQ